MQTTVLAIGRWMPIHIGHKNFLINLAKKYDRLVIGIGSCYENGTPRNCIPAIEREKLLRKIFKNEGLSNVIIVPVQDRPTFEAWFMDVVALCDKYQVTHFCTGNKEDILNVMKEKNLHLETEMINPEDTSDFPYHATDIRNAILNNELDLLDSMLPPEIKSIVLSQVAKEIKMASEGKGQEFIPGRQTVDIVFVVNDTEKKKKYLLTGKRNSEKIDFPNTWAIPGGGIKEFESPIDAATRCFFAETGIEITVNDNSCEPAEIIIENLGAIKSEMFFTGIYASEDERINGTLGGGSQCFAVVVDGNVDEFSSVLCSTHDMDELKFVEIDVIHGIDFAYDQKRMVFEALNRLGIAYNNGEMLQVYDSEGNALNEGVSRLVAHSEGVLHGASHTYIYKWEANKLFLLLQRRSLNKDSFPGCLDTSSAGHIEYGSDFLQTAKKELLEELGIDVDVNNLEELFTQRIHSENIFHQKVFNDNEINVVYAVEMDLNESELELQASEVSEVVWMSANDIIEKFNNSSSELCINPEEGKRVIDTLLEKYADK